MKRFARPGVVPSLGMEVVHALAERDSSDALSVGLRHRFLSYFTADRAADGMTAFYKSAMRRRSHLGRHAREKSACGQTLTDRHHVQSQTSTTKS